MIVLGQRPNLGKYARDYAIVSALPWGATESSLFSGASPAVANGDCSACTVTSPGGYTVALTRTGVLTIDTNNSTDRQSFYCDVYDVSLRQWFGDTIEWVNNKLPVFDNSLGVVPVRIGEATSIDISAAVTDADSDVLTYAVVSGSLPPGLTLDSMTGIISGTA